MKIEVDKIVQGALVSLLVMMCVGAFKTYIAVEMMRKDIEVLKGQNDSLRRELTDLWVQANEQLQRDGRPTGSRTQVR